MKIFVKLAPSTNELAEMVIQNTEMLIKILAERQLEHLEKRILQEGGSIYITQKEVGETRYVRLVGFSENLQNEILNAVKLEN